jgi:hypothetical protein
MKEQVIFSSNIKFSKRFMSNFKWSLIFTPVLIAFLIATPINFNEIIYNIHYLIIVFLLASTSYISYQRGKYYIQEIKLNENKISLIVLRFNSIHINEEYEIDKIKIFKKALNSKHPRFKLQISYMGKIIISQFDASDWDEKMMDSVIGRFNELCYGK